MPSPDLDVANALQAAAVGTVGTDLFVGRMRPPSDVIPQAVLFVAPTGGAGPTPFLDGGSQDYSIFAVQVLVRGDVGTYLATQAKAESVLAALHKAAIAGYFQTLARTPQPLYLGLDDTEHPIFSVNVELFHTG